MRIRVNRTTWGLAGLTLVIVWAFLWTAPAHRPAPAPRLPAQPPTQRFVPDPIDGEPVSGALAARRPIAIMIDNFPEARPQWGLSAASRVYEAITEGGITRYLAIFAEHDAARIGPVRSARTQFLNYTLELDAALAHVGGNADALALIEQLRVKDLNEFRFGDAFHRIFAPHVAFEHTVFTSTDALRAVTQPGWDEDVTVGAPHWKDDAPPAQRPANQSVSIAFSFPEYAVSWIYRPASNDYVRQLGGTEDTDAGTGQALTAKSIAIAVVPRTHGRTVIGEDTWTFSDLGSGQAWVVEDGVAVTGTWRKASRIDRLRFFDQAGNEIAFDRGPEWVEVVPPEVNPVFSP
ncbi:MAG TPA: DUF3048 domain-containing protein [bacterium]|nr:DUF3048 domain-containing protein [bacterium]